ncbi:MAG: hypothetical protein COA44_08420 [Arcobacter sp.]|nr:MAG: hypothetical protein COA44_08420 [Arcobacter sp.]
MKYILMLFLVFSTISSAQEDKVFTINTGFKAPANKFVEMITLEAFKRAGLKINFQGLPNKRSLINANSGIDDGDAARVWEISDYYPNLIRVSVKNSQIDIVVLTNKKIIINELSDLSKYNVGVIHGMKIAVVSAQKANPVSLYKAKDYETLVKMLSIDRLDLILTNRVSLYRNMKALEGKKLYLREEPLLSRPLYLHLHKKNKAYIPVLEKAYRSMHEDGTYTKLHDEFYKEFEGKLEQSLIILNN